MSLTQTIEIDGQPVKFRASAAIPRIYRLRFHRDIYKDLSLLEKSVSKQDEDNSGLDLFSLEMYFNTFSIYQILPKLIELWGLNVQTDVQSKKNLDLLTGK